MAKSKRNTRTNGKAAMARAVKELRGTYEPISALDGLGEKYAQSELDAYSGAEIVSTLCEKARGHIYEAMDAIAHLKHPATKQLLGACDALDVAEGIFSFAGKDDDTARAYRGSLGRTLLSFAAEAGRLVDKAQRSLGGEVLHSAWLDDLQNLNGLPDNLRVLDTNEQWLIQTFNRIPRERQTLVADFMKQLAQQEVGHA